MEKLIEIPEGIFTQCSAYKNGHLRPLRIDHNASNNGEFTVTLEQERIVISYPQVFETNVVDRSTCESIKLIELSPGKGEGYLEVMLICNDADKPILNVKYSIYSKEWITQVVHDLSDLLELPEVYENVGYDF